MVIISFEIVFSIIKNIVHYKELDKIEILKRIYPDILDWWEEGLTVQVLGDQLHIHAFNIENILQIKLMNEIIFLCLMMKIIPMIITHRWSLQQETCFINFARTQPQRMDLSEAESAHQFGWLLRQIEGTKKNNPLSQPCANHLFFLLPYDLHTIVPPLSIYIIYIPKTNLQQTRRLW